jgi:hypothetical protein
MKITPDGVRLLANSLQQASEALRDMAVFLSSLAVEPEQTELPAAGTDLGATVVLTYSPEVQAAAKKAIASLDLTVPPEQIQAVAKKLVEEPIEHSPEYLASKRACVEVAPEAPMPVKEEPITRQSLRALAEKLVAKGRLPDVKAALAKFGATTLSALKPENYAAVNATFTALLA